MSLNHALFGDEYALSAIEQMLESDDIESVDITENNKPTTPFDDNVNNNLSKVKRRRRKSAPDDVQIMAEQYQKNKDERIWARLQGRLYRPLLKYINGITKNRMLAEDAVAVSFARANECIHQYDASKSKFSTWLWTMAYRQCLYDIKIDERIDTISYDNEWLAEGESTHRNMQIMQEACQKYNQGQPDYYIIDNNQECSVESLTAQGVTQRLYDVSINAISEIKNEATKNVVEMKLIKEMTIKDISIALNMTQSNVKNHLYKGKSDLVVAIKSNYPDLYDLYLDVMSDNDRNMWNI